MKEKSIVGQWDVIGKKSKDSEMTSVVYAIRVTWRKKLMGVQWWTIDDKSSSKCQGLFGSWMRQSTIDDIIQEQVWLYKTQVVTTYNLESCDYYRKENPKMW